MRFTTTSLTPGAQCVWLTNLDLDNWRFFFESCLNPHCASPSLPSLDTGQSDRMDARGHVDGLGYDIPNYVPHQPPGQIFGNYNADGSPGPATLATGNYYGDQNDGGAEDADPKRRRIARVRCPYPGFLCRRRDLTMTAGL